MGWPWKSRFASRSVGSGRDGSLPSLRGKPASLYHCVVCKEAWPLSTSREQIFTCSRCKREKKPCRLYSAENDMDPGSVPAELQGLSEVEELLIARAFPMMSIYRKHGGQGDIRDTFSIGLKIFRAFWIASQPTWVTCQYWWSGSKVQVSVSNIK